MACDCKLCVRNRLIDSQINLLPENQQAFFTDMFDLLLNTEMDLNHCEAIIDGSWPDSDEIIARKRDKVNNTLD